MSRKLLPFLIFAVLASINVCAEVKFSTDSVTICRDSSFDLQDFLNNQVTIDEGWKVIGWRDITNTIVTPTTSPTTYTLQYYEESSPYTIYKKNLNIYLAEKPSVSISLSGKHTACKGSEINVECVSAIGCDDMFWKNTQTGDTYKTKDLKVKIDGNRYDIVTYKLIATSEICASDIAEESVSFVIVDNNLQNDLQFTNFVPKTNITNKRFKDGVSYYHMSYCDTTFNIASLFTELDYLTIYLSKGGSEVLYRKLSVDENDADFEITNYEIVWDNTDEYTSGEKVLSEGDYTNTFTMNVTLRDKSCGNIIRHSEKRGIILEHNCELDFKNLDYFCNEKNGKASISFDYKLPYGATLDSIVWTNTTVAGKYIPAESYSYLNEETGYYNNQYSVTWDISAPENVNYNLDIYYTLLGGTHTSKHIEDLETNPCKVKTFLAYYFEEQDNFNYYSFADYESVSSNNNYGITKSTTEKPYVLNKTYCSKYYVYFVLDCNACEPLDIIWDNENVPEVVQYIAGQYSILPDYSITKEGEKWHIKAAPRAYSNLGTTGVVLRIIPSATTTYTGTCCGFPFSFKATIHTMDRMIAETVHICRGASIDLKSLENPTQISGELQWMVSNTVVTPEFTTTYRAYGIPKYPCSTAAGEEVMQTTTVYVDEPIWVTAKVPDVYVGETFDLMDFISTNDQDVYWYKNGKPVSTTIHVANEEDSYQYIVSNKCGQNTGYIYINPKVCTPIHVDIDTTICQDSVFVLGDTIIRTPGTYERLLKTPHQCDSIVTLTLRTEVCPCDTQRVEMDAYVCDGEQYEFGNRMLNVSGTYVETFQSHTGCDSIVTLHLVVHSAIEKPLYHTLCEGRSFQFGDTILWTAGTYVRTFTAAAGCDSIVTLYLTLVPCECDTIYTRISRHFCEGAKYRFAGKTLTQTGIYTDTLESASGCDSIVILSLFIQSPIETSVEKSICFGDFIEFGDQKLTQAGTYTSTFLASGGCDSIVTLELSIRQCETVIAKDDSVSIDICDDQVTIDVGRNDKWTCGNPKFQLISQSAYPGSEVYMNGRRLTYYNAQRGYEMIDTCRYSVSCGVYCDTATVYIHIRTVARIDVEIRSKEPACEFDYVILNGRFYNNDMMEKPFYYQWQYSGNGIDWTPANAWTMFTGTNIAVLQKVYDAKQNLFRLLITGNENLELETCYAMSNILPIFITPASDTIRVKGCGIVEYEGEYFRHDTTFVNYQPPTDVCGNQVIDVHVERSPYSEQDVFFCDEITVDGDTYTTDTTLIRSYEVDPEAMCDSISTLHLHADCSRSGQTIGNLLINKYNWVLFCNNKELYAAVENVVSIDYQWYKNNVPIEDYNHDFYEESSALNGCFRVKAMVTDVAGVVRNFYSETVCVNENPLMIVPNPVSSSENAKIDYNFDDAQRYGLTVTIYNSLGIEVYTAQPTSYPIILPSGLAPGLYIVQITTGKSEVFTLRLVVR